MNTHLTSIIAISLSLGVVATSCGDDGEALSAQEFRDQASVIICDGDQEIGAAIGQLFGEGDPTPERMQETLDTLLSVSRDQAEQIDALAEPSDLSADVDVLLTEWRKAADTAEAQGPGYFESDDNPWEQTEVLAGELGLVSCSGE